MKKLFTIFSFLFSIPLFAQNDISLSYYLPDNVSYSEEIPTPQEILGFVPGKWHVSHDRLVTYMNALAEASPRITIENRGNTFEDRPLLLLTITSPANHQKIKEIQQKHIALVENDSENIDINNLPAVVYQGFSIHGNEPSGSNAALVAAYYLAAAQGPEIDKLLSNIVILFDPSFNPDGLQRFAYWANTNKSKNISTDPQDREYSEIWPGGRTNHYWFDMNRDWLPVQLPESRARIKTFHQWYPNILTDHHEMGPNSSFFFQPGIQSRTHPLTPKLNQSLTKEIAKFHAKALDKIGSFYYTEENFDDFYYGKGSTFPDINGGIGILFEQGSSRGHAQETENGILTFPFTIRNQFAAVLSTLEAALNMRKELLKYKRDFYQKSMAKKTNESYVFGNEKDAASTYHLAEILKRHKIKIYEINKDTKINDKNYKKGYSYVVPKSQRQQKLIEAIFEKRTTFQDSLFYDISAWTFPLAFNMDYTLSNANLKGKEITNLTKQKPVPIAKSNYAYLMEWHEYYSPKVLYQILQKGLRAKVAMKTFSLEEKTYDYGTIMIPVQNQKSESSEIYKILSKLSRENSVPITGVSTGLTEGIDLGSNQLKAIELPKIALFTGSGITPYDAGEIWHLMDQRYDIPITKITTDNFSRTDLSNYSHIILPNAWSNALQKSQVNKIKDWIRAGGTIIGYRNISRFFNDSELMKLNFKRTEHKAKNISFEEQQDFNGAQVIGGAIFEANIDRSHPINFGYKNNKIALFRNTTYFIEPDEQSYKNPIQYTKSPLLSGYISKQNLDNLSGTVPFKHRKLGRGNVIVFTDNTNFRAFWYGTNKLMMNAIFFSNEM